MLYMKRYIGLKTEIHEEKLGIQNDIIIEAEGQLRDIYTTTGMFLHVPDRFNVILKLCFQPPRTTVNILCAQG